MAGWIAIDRDIFEHEFFAREPMSEREAWIWIISRAGWKATRQRVGSDMVDIPRGAFLSTLRDLQHAWGWRSDSRVRSFLKRLELERMVESEIVVRKDARKTQVSVCNYDEYQSIERGSNAGENAGGTQGPTQHIRNNKEQGNKRIQQQDAREAVPASPPPENPTDWTPDHLLDEVMAAVGLRSGRIPTHWMPPAATVHVWRWVTDLKLSPDSIIAATRESRKRHREAPTGPKALDGVMTRLAGEIANPPLQPTPGAYAQSTVVPIRKIRAQLPSEVSK